MAHIRIETATPVHTSLHTILYADNEQQAIVPHAAPAPQYPTHAELQGATLTPAPTSTSRSFVAYARQPEPYPQPAWHEPVTIPDIFPSPNEHTISEHMATIDHSPYRDAEGNVCELCRITEARIDLKKSHAFLSAGALLHALGEHFFHLHFAETDDGILFDAYANDCFVVTYCLNAHGNDQLRVRWIDPEAEEAHTEYELPDMARQIARLLGGGTNLRLLDSMVRCIRLPVPDVVV